MDSCQNCAYSIEINTAKDVFLLCSVPYGYTEQNHHHQKALHQMYSFLTLPGFAPKHRASLWYVKGNGFKIVWDECKDCLGKKKKKKLFHDVNRRVSSFPHLSLAKNFSIENVVQKLGSSLPSQFIFKPKLCYRFWLLFE